MIIQLTEKNKTSVSPRCWYPSAPLGDLRAHYLFNRGYHSIGVTIPFTVSFPCSNGMAQTS